MRSVEDALKWSIPANAQLIRNLMIGAQYIHDHVMHFYHLHALDWVDVVSALKADPKATAALAQSRYERGLTSQLEVLEARPMGSRPDVGLVRQRWEVLNQHRKVVMTMEGWGMLRRRPAQEAPGAPSSDNEVVNFGPFAFDLGARTLHKNGIAHRDFYLGHLVLAHLLIQRAAGGFARGLRAAPHRDGARRRVFRRHALW